MACRHDECIFVASSVGTMGILNPIRTFGESIADGSSCSEGQARCEVE